MAGVHDVGGKPGYGAPQLSSTLGVAGSAFAARWEAAVFAMMRCLGGVGVMKNTDQFRHAVERVDPTNYYSHGYYGRWLGGLETLLVEAGALDRATLDARVGELAAQAGATAAEIARLTQDANIASRPLPAHAVEPVPPSPNAGSSVRYVSQPPGFCVGDPVQAQRPTVDGVSSSAADITGFRHCRLPDYANGCTGQVVRWHGGWVLPDSNAHGEGESASHLYTVSFAARSLYGASAEAGVVVHLDLFEPYLRPGQSAGRAAQD